MSAARVEQVPGLHDCNPQQLPQAASLKGHLGIAAIGAAIAQGAARGAISSAATQGISIAAGIQDKFSFAQVGAAAIGGGIAGGLDLALPGVSIENGIASVNRLNIAAASLIGGLANAGVRTGLLGGSFGDNFVAAIPDIIGQAIGGVRNATREAAQRNAGAQAELNARTQATQDRLNDTLDAIGQGALGNAQAGQAVEAATQTFYKSEASATEKALSIVEANSRDRIETELTVQANLSGLAPQADDLQTVRESRFVTTAPGSGPNEPSGSKGEIFINQLSVLGRGDQGSSRGITPVTTQFGVEASAGFVFGFGAGFGVFYGTKRNGDLDFGVFSTQEVGFVIGAEIAAEASFPISSSEPVFTDDLAGTGVNFGFSVGFAGAEIDVLDLPDGNKWRGFRSAGRSPSNGPITIPRTSIGVELNATVTFTQTHSIADDFRAIGDFAGRVLSPLANLAGDAGSIHRDIGTVQSALSSPRFDEAKDLQLRDLFNRRLGGIVKPIFGE